MKIYYLFITLYICFKIDIYPGNTSHIGFNNFFGDTTSIVDTADYFTKADYSIEIKNAEGAIVKLNTWQDKNLLIIYAHPDYPYCKKLVNRYQTEIRSPDIEVIILFGGNDHKETILDFIKETSSTFAFYYDYKYQFKREYGRNIVPLTMFIHSD